MYIKFGFYYSEIIMYIKFALCYSKNLNVYLKDLVRKI